MKRFGLQYEIDGSVVFNTQTFKPIGRLPQTAADRFEQQAFDLLTKIDTETTVGRRILRAAWLGRTVNILPASTFGGAIPLNPADAMLQGATKTTTSGKTFTGTGAGSDVVVFLGPDPAPLMGPGAQKDAVLLHEIVHAVRATNGLFHQAPMFVYDDKEEFYAVTLANMYISAAYPNQPLRGDHSGTPLHSPGKSDKVIAMLTQPGLPEQKLYYFVMQNKDLLLKLIDEMEALCIWLKDAPCKFNPLRVCYNGYDPAVEEANLPPDRRRTQGYGPLVKETFAQAADRLLKNQDPEKIRQMFGGL